MEVIEIVPSVIEFPDADCGQVLKKKISIHNRGKRNNLLRIVFPKNKCFSFRLCRKGSPGTDISGTTPLPPGAQIFGVVTYCATEPKQLQDKIVFSIENDVKEIPVIAFPSQPELSMDDDVNYGNISCSGKIVMKNLFISNRGAQEGSFKLLYPVSRKASISFEPPTGKVPPKSTKIVKVGFLADKTGPFKEYAQVDLEGSAMTQLCISGNVSVSSLTVLSCETGDKMDCVQFGPAYYGTDVTRNGILFNDCRDRVAFVVILNDGAIGQQLGDDISDDLVGGRINSVNSLVTVIPAQGVLAPYQKIPIFFKFSPRWNCKMTGFRSTCGKTPCHNLAMFVQFRVLGSNQNFLSCLENPVISTPGATNDAVNQTASGSLVRSDEPLRPPSLEIGLTATAVPLEVKFVPNRLDFGECLVKDCLELSCVASNFSQLLPVTFQFQRIAHFLVEPSRGILHPGQTKELKIYFAPNQAGSFTCQQFVNVFGRVCDELNPFVTYPEIVGSEILTIIGCAIVPTIHKEPVFNKGITPKITNEVGFVMNGVKTKDLCKAPRATKVNPDRLISIQKKMDADKENTFLAFPNDRACSIRPSNRKETYETIFMHFGRHTYIDPDYSFTDEEIAAAEKHRKYYADLLKELRSTRLEKRRTREYKRYHNNKDSDLKPAAGIGPPKLNIADITADESKPKDNPSVQSKAASLVTTSELADKLQESSKKLRSGLNAIPTTTQEKIDCKKLLSPLELHQIAIGPPTVNFGKVCVMSTTQLNVSIINNLNYYVHFVVKVDSVDSHELRHTSPLSQVIPPRSKAVLPLVFEPNIKGRYQKSLEYTINGFYKNDLQIFAEVVPVCLEMSCSELIAEAQLGLPPATSIRSTVVLYNRLNYAAQFMWNPIVTDKGTAFSIRPASGVVAPYSELRCEVVFHASFAAATETLFVLQVIGGETLTLKCTAKIDGPKVVLGDRRMDFGFCPLHLMTTRHTVIKNVGHTPAFFQVVDPSPFPGLVITPTTGSILAGGAAFFTATFCPTSAAKFDTKFKIALKKGGNLVLRVGGTVELPAVDIDRHNFNLGGVCCGSLAVENFVLSNKGKTKTRVEFDLTRTKDFTIDFGLMETKEDSAFNFDNPGMFAITLSPDDQISTKLVFKPTEVASYDFVMPVTINDMGAPSPCVTPLSGRRLSISAHMEIITPRRRIIATALRKPLQISQTHLHFSVPLAFLNSRDHIQSIELKNISNKELKWSCDLSHAGQDRLLLAGRPVLGSSFSLSKKHNDISYFRLTLANATEEVSRVWDNECSCYDFGGTLQPEEEAIIHVKFLPGEKLKTFACIPFILNDNLEQPYTYFNIGGEVRLPKLTFNPPCVVLGPVPLETPASSEFTITATDYFDVTTIMAMLPVVECEDGSRISPLCITLGGSNSGKPQASNAALMTDITPVCDTDKGISQPFMITCGVTFKSFKPISFSDSIKFVDDSNHVYSFVVTATSDNCLFTSYPFIAIHHSDYHIVCAQGKSLKGRRTASRESSDAGEAVIVSFDPQVSTSRPQSTTTDSIFDPCSPFLDGSLEDLASVSTRKATPHGYRDGKCMVEEEEEDNYMDEMKASLDLFPDEETEVTVFHEHVLDAVEKWFGSQGWPTGQHVVKIPESLQVALSKKGAATKSKSGKSVVACDSVSKETKTVYEMVSYLCGKSVPGCDPGAALPPDPEPRAEQIFNQHCALLNFVRVQGGCVSSIKPEYLMEFKDFHVWVKMERRTLSELSEERQPDISAEKRLEALQSISSKLFEALSKRAWLNLLLQLVKTLVLAKITPRQFKTMPSPYRPASMSMVDPNPLGSNIYSIGERILLLWLNHHFEQQRTIVWSNATKRVVPPPRWIVNFDLDLIDGLVFGSLLAAYAPFLIKSHLSDMYTRPAGANECLHNSIIITDAVRAIGIEYDIEAVDIADPNPITLLLFTIHLYNALPQFLTRSSVEFDTPLYQTVAKQVKVCNPGLKPLMYRPLIVGQDAQDFVIDKQQLGADGLLAVPPRSNTSIMVQFISRFLRPANGVLLLVGKRHGATVGSTLAFNLNTNITNVIPIATTQVDCPCYTLMSIFLKVANRFAKPGNFRIILVECEKESPNPSATFDRSSQTKVQSLDASKLQTSSQGIRSFFCKQQSIFLDPTEPPSSLQLSFVPMSMGQQQCFVVLTDDVGEIVYLVKGNGVLPPAEVVPIVDGAPLGARIKTDAVTALLQQMAASPRPSLFPANDDSEEPTIFYKCIVGETLEETVQIPVRNRLMEQAVLTIARLMMSELELSRRTQTGVVPSLLDTLSRAGKNGSKMPKTGKNGTQRDVTVYRVEIDSKYFKSSVETLTIPNYNESFCSVDEGNSEQTASLPITFLSHKAGQYQSRIVLRSETTARVFTVSCLVLPSDGSNAVIEFSSTVQHSIKQNIPIVNQSQKDWTMSVTLNGGGFTGPSVVSVPAHSCIEYPLAFTPASEEMVEGKVVMKNSLDGVENTISLKGVGKKPQPVDTISLTMQVKQSIDQVLNVPNVTKSKLRFKVESDIPFFTGPDSITVLSRKTGYYELNIKPTQRGRFHGVISFVSTEGDKEYDSDGDEISEPLDPSLVGHRVWYLVDINVKPGKPEATLSVTCPCRGRVCVEVALTNPVQSKLTFSVAIFGTGLSGPPEFTVAPCEKGVYHLMFAPTVVGKNMGSIILFNPSVGEFWYSLVLTAEPPLPIVIPTVSSELGRSVFQPIELTNPTNEVIMYQPIISNRNNFAFADIDDQLIRVAAQSYVNVTVVFTPSKLGVGDQTAVISFLSQQLGESRYIISGSGLEPEFQEVVTLTAAAGSNSTTIVEFRNPTDVPVLAKVSLCDYKIQQSESKSQNNCMEEKSPFHLLLKNAASVRVASKAVLQIPLAFAPQEMKHFEGKCVVALRREDGANWIFQETVTDQPTSPPLPNTGLPELQWSYVVRGYVDASPSSESVSPVRFLARARERIEERLEVLLTGIRSCTEPPRRIMTRRAPTPPDKQDGSTNDLSTNDREYSYGIAYKDDIAQSDLEPSVAVQLIRKNMDQTTGWMALLTFSVVYAPYKIMKHDVELIVEAATGGRWHFPLRFISTEPQADDVIRVHAVALNKDASMAFRLTSQTDCPTKFTARFLPGSDAAFSVSPQYGELPARDEKGMLFIVKYRPTVYGHAYKAKLFVETADMHWIYDVLGVLPEYGPPVLRPAFAGPHPDPRYRGEKVNFLQDNLRLITTAVSSPLKGAPLLGKRRVTSLGLSASLPTNRSTIDTRTGCP